MPPFVGAVALQLIFGRNGSVNLLLDQWISASRSRSRDGLVGVMFVESIHYFPFILLNLVAAMRNIDGAMEEVGAEPRRARLPAVRIIFPLAMPGFLAGAALVFVKVFDDLERAAGDGRDQHARAAAYLRITSVGIDDPMGYVISVLMIAFSSSRCGWQRV